MRLYVKEFRPSEWFLLGDEESAADYYLDVNCDVGAFGFSMLVRLSQAELEEYRDVGRVYVEYLAVKIRNDAETARGAAMYSLPSPGPSRYGDRDLSRTLGPQVTDAIVAFKQSRPDMG